MANNYCTLYSVMAMKYFSLVVRVCWNHCALYTTCKLENGKDGLTVFQSRSFALSLLANEDLNAEVQRPTTCFPQWAPGWLQLSVPAHWPLRQLLHRLCLTSIEANMKFGPLANLQMVCSMLRTSSLSRQPGM